MSFHVAGSGVAELQEQITSLNKRLDKMEKTTSECRELVHDLKGLFTEAVTLFEKHFPDEHKDHH